MVYHHNNVIVSYSTSRPPSVTQPPQNLSAAIMSKSAMPPTDAALRLDKVWDASAWTCRRHRAWHEISTSCKVKATRAPSVKPGLQHVASHSKAESCK